MRAANIDEAAKVNALFIKATEIGLKKIISYLLTHKIDPRLAGPFMTPKDLLNNIKSLEHMMHLKYLLVHVRNTQILKLIFS